MAEYDMWYRDALTGKIRYFHTPRRIYILEVSRAPLFIYHSHEKKIVGEAAINKATKENGLFHYWFNEFLPYPNFVDLTKIKTDKNLWRLAGKGRWNIRYLDDKTIEEIRNLSQLPTEIKEKLADELQNIKRKIAQITKPKYLSYRQDRLAFALSKLKEIGLEHQIDDATLNKAYQIFTKASEKGVLRGRSASDFIYASLYTAYRLLKIPITIEEFSKLYSLKSKKLVHNYRTLLRHLTLTVPRPRPKDFVMKYSPHLSISQETRRLAASIIENIEKSLTVGRSPRTVAATVVYLVCKNRDEPVTQKQIAEAFRISEVSIRNYMKLLHESSKDVLNFEKGYL